MVFLRPFLMALLVAALLPWGAWRAAAHPPVTPAPEAVTVLVAVGPVRLASSAHRCRTAVLSGQSCGSDLALLPLTPGVVGPEARDARPPAAILLDAGILPGLVTPPPRRA